MRTERFDFQGSGGQALSGRMVLPAGPARAYALFAHCFTCTRNSLAAVHVSRALAEHGIGVLRFDFTGLGESEGDFVDSTFSGNVRDLLAAAAAMHERGYTPSLLVGHSLGGAAVLAAAAQLDGIVAVATIGAPFAAEHITSHFGDRLEEINARGHAQVDLGGGPVTIGRGLLEDLGQHDPEAALANLGAALLVLHAPGDAIVGIDSASRIFQAARHPKSFVSLDGADHLLTQAADAQFVAAVVAAWAGRYLAQPSVEAPAQVDGLAHVAETGAGGFQVQVRIGAATFLADEPEDVGGLGSGPTPYELLCAALGACTVMTLRMYARHKKLELTRLSAAVGHRKEGGEAVQDLFTRSVRIEGDIDESQRRRLLEIADRCPVHRTLEGSARVQTVEAGAGAELPAPEPVQRHAAEMRESARRS